MTDLRSITVIITCYKEGTLLQEAIESLLNQRYQNWQCILVNDASDDKETNNICKSFESHPQFRIIWNPKNIGLSGSRNAGIAAVDDGICFCLDGDDRLPRDSLQIIAETFDKHPFTDFVYGDFREFGGRSQTHSPGVLSLENMLLSQPIDGHSPFRRYVWEKIGGYAQELSWGNQDWDFWLSVFEAGFHGKYINEVLYEWRIRDDSMHQSYEDRWYKIREFMYQKHKETYDKFGKGPAFLAGGWKKTAFYHYQRRNFKKALECAEQSLKLFPHDIQMKQLRLRCKIPVPLLDIGRAAKRILKRLGKEP
jgi:glycosyltransferase involved in cell wall biosynthesis